MNLKKFTFLLLATLLVIGLSACNVDDDRDLTRDYNRQDGLAPYTNDYNDRNGLDFDLNDRNGNVNNYGYMGNDRNGDMNANREADEMARLAARVRGVDDATVVIAGNEAYVALDLEDNISNRDSTRVEKNVRKSLKRYAKGYDVNITSDADMFGRLRDIDNGIRNGTPVERYQRDLDGIGDDIGARRYEGIRGPANDGSTRLSR